MKVEAKVDIDNFILVELNSLWISPIFLDKPVLIFANSYSDYFQKIAIYLTTLRQPVKINIKEFNSFKKKAFKFKIQDSLLFWGNNKNVPMRRVVNNLIKQQTIL